MATNGPPPKYSKPPPPPLPPPPKRKGPVEAPSPKHGKDRSDDVEGLFWLWALFG